MAETQTYNHTEMQRYLQHKMSPQEMHAFEKALMNDPFLADALEGFSSGDAALASKHIAAIESSLSGNQQQAKVIPLPGQKTAGWKVAAIVLAVVSAGAITYSVVNNRGASDMTKVQLAPTGTVEKDSIGPADKPVARLETLRYKQSSHKSNNTSPVILSDANKPLAYQKQLNAGSDEMRDTMTEKPPSMASLSVAPERQKEEASSVTNNKQTDSEVVIGYGTFKKSNVTGAIAAVSSIAQNEFKGKVVDKSGEPVPFASVSAKDNGITTTTDRSGNFTIKGTDTVLKVNVSSLGYAGAMAKIKSSKPDNKISLNEDELSLAEVVVRGMGRKTKKTATAVQIDSSIAAEPVGGWKNFTQYLNRQLDSLKAIEAGNDFDEDVVLEFTIDKQGKPANIKASAEADKMMAEKAILIFSNGPRWKNRKKGKKVKVVIALNL